MRHFEDRPFTEMRFRDVPDGSLYRIDLRNNGVMSCWARKGPHSRTHPNRMAQVAC